MDDAERVNVTLEHPCRACAAPAVWVDLSYLPVRGHQLITRLVYWCAECAEKNPIGEQ